MEQQLLRDSSIEPTDSVMAEALGDVYTTYAAFVDGLNSHDIQVDWRYYNDGKAWLGKGQYKWMTTRGTQKETTAFWLSIWNGFFKITIYIPEKSRMEALSLPLDNDIRNMIENAKQMGKLKFFPLTFDLRSNELFAAIYTIADFRKAIK